MPGRPKPVSSQTLLRARWFNGQSSQAQSVLVSLQPGPQGPALQLHLLAQVSPELRVFNHGQVGWPEAWNARKAPAVVTVDLRDQGSLEIDDGAQWQAALAAAGARPSLAQRMQTRWPVFVAVLAVAAIALWALYRWGTPWAATQITRQVPVAWEAGLAERALQQLDGHHLQPSQLSAARQAQLHERFQALASGIGPGLQRYPGYVPQLRLAFRSGMGANALALPGGTVVISDGLVEAAATKGLSDDALVGVLAHEMGHVVHRHTTRMVVEQGVLNVGLGLALGDVSNLLSVSGSLLTGLAYRRSHEAEADCFAIALMHQVRLPTAPMADLLLGLGEAREGKKEPHKAAGSPLANLLSSHPDTAIRAQRLRQGLAQGC